MPAKRRKDPGCRHRRRQEHEVGKPDHQVRDRPAWATAVPARKLARAKRSDKGPTRLYRRHHGRSGQTGHDRLDGFIRPGATRNGSGQITEDVPLEEPRDRVLSHGEAALRSDEHRGQDTEEHEDRVTEQERRRAEASDDRIPEHLREPRGAAHALIGPRPRSVNDGEEERPARESRDWNKSRGRKHEVGAEGEAGKRVGVR